MKYLYKTLCFCALSAFGLQALAQTTDSVAPKKPYLKFGMTYYSDNVYLGRTDTVTAPSYEPTLSYTFKSGVYFSGALEYFPNRVTNKLDGGNIEAGYNFDATQNLSGGVSFTKSFYNTNSTQVQSEIGSNFDAFLDYDIADIITPYIGFDYGFAKSGFKDDILLTPSLSHDFEIDGIFDDNDLLLISPEVDMNTGTQNFFDSYLTAKATKAKKVTKVQAAEIATYNADLSTYKTYLSNFTVLDYEFTLPIEYKLGHLILNFTPTYALPQNGLAAPQTAIETLIQAGVPRIKSNQFYFNTGITLKF